MPRKETFIQKNTTYYLWTEGDRKNPALVILPGFTGTHNDLLDFARQFKDDYFVILPDFPGWGDSPQGAYNLTIEGYVQFIHDVLEKIHVDNMFLAGHCMGSVIAIEFAYRYPQSVSNLFVVSVPYLQGTPSQSYFTYLAHESGKVPKIIRPLFFFFRSRVFAIPLGFFVIQTRSLRKKLRIMWGNAIKQQFQNEYLVEKNWNSLVLFNYKKLHNLSMPLHIFHGEKDLLVPSHQAEKLLALCPKATFDIIPKSGHMPPVETPETLAKMIKKYL